MKIFPSRLIRPIVAHPGFGVDTAVIPAALIQTPVFSSWTQRFFKVAKGLPNTRLQDKMKGWVDFDLVGCSGNCGSPEFDLMMVLAWFSFIPNETRGYLPASEICKALGYTNSELNRRGPRAILESRIKNLLAFDAHIESTSNTWVPGPVWKGCIFNELTLDIDDESGRIFLYYNFSEVWVKSIHHRFVAVPMRAMYLLFTQSESLGMSRQTLAYICSWTKTTLHFTVNGNQLAKRISGVRTNGKQRIGKITENDMVGKALAEIARCKVATVREMGKTGVYGPEKWTGKILSLDPIGFDIRDSNNRIIHSSDENTPKEVPVFYYEDEAIRKFLEIMQTSVDGKVYLTVKKIYCPLGEEERAFDLTAKMPPSRLNEYVIGGLSDNIKILTQLPNNLIQIDDLTIEEFDRLANGEVAYIPTPLFVLASSDFGRQAIFFASCKVTSDLKRAICNAITIPGGDSKPNTDPNGSMRIPGSLNYKYSPPQRVGIWVPRESGVIDDDVARKIIDSHMDLSPGYVRPLSHSVTKIKGSRKNNHTLGEAKLGAPPPLGYEPVPPKGFSFPSIRKDGDQSRNDFQAACAHIECGVIKGVEDLWMLAAWLMKESKHANNKVKCSSREASWSYAAWTVKNAYRKVIEEELKNEEKAAKGAQKKSKVEVKPLWRIKEDPVF